MTPISPELEEFPIGIRQTQLLINSIVHSILSYLRYPACILSSFIYLSPFRACLPACLPARLPAATNNEMSERALAMEAPTLRAWMTTVKRVMGALVSCVFCFLRSHERIGIPTHRNLSAMTRLRFECSPRPLLLPPGTCLISPFGGARFE